LSKKEKTAKKESILLRANPKCRVCWGRGWVRVHNPVNNTKEVRPCSCVRAKVDEWPEPDATIMQGIY